MHSFAIPPVGHRTLKSAVSVLLCYAVYLLRGHQGLVFYSMLAALWCIRPYFDNTVQMAVQRVSGTLIGAVYGLIILLVDAYFLDAYFGDAYADVYELLYCLIVAAAIVPIIETTLILKHKDVSYFSCVVFLSIAVNHVGDDNPYIFVLNRVVDTLIGVAIGIGVNTLHLPVRKRDDILFVSGVDDTLIAQDEMLSDYSRRQFNYLIDRGANFTISTMRAPATVQKILSGVHLKLPIIAMDGAVLYDM
ncbi:MAG: FUSC family protein, partial [Clostridiales bacterium]|nr:FUSC family protein [Clostridiales bacterium]